VKGRGGGERCCNRQTREAREERIKKDEVERGKKVVSHPLSSSHSSILVRVFDVFLLCHFFSLLEPPTQPEVRDSRLHSVMDNEREEGGEGIDPKSTLILSTLAY